MHVNRIAMPIAALAAVVLLAASFAHAQDAKAITTLDGNLAHLDNGPALRMKGKEILLSTVRTWHLNTLKDKRLEGREIRVEGEWAADRTFKVSQFYTVKDGKRFRVRYYCEVCNIESLEPGKCVCCQAPTELQEVPVDK
jgi:hypothetical protein